MLKIDREIDKIYNILRKMLFENKMIIKMIKKKKKFMSKQLIKVEFGYY